MSARGRENRNRRAFRVEEAMPRSTAVFVFGLALGARCVPAHAQGVEAEPEASALAPVVMSKELLEGAPTGSGADGLHVQADVRVATETSGEAAAVYHALFRVDTGAAQSVAPASLLDGIGIERVGTASYERADGTVEERPFGVVRLEFMGEMREGRILFGPEDVEPAVGVNALEAIGLTIDPGTRTIQRLDP